MPEGIWLALSLLAAIAPFIISVGVALQPESRPSGIFDYFLFRKELPESEFLTTSVGYSLQVAAIVLFITWFFYYGLSSIFVPVAWGAGYFLIALSVEKGALQPFLQQQGHTDTIHGYLADAARTRKRPLVYVLAFTTIIGLGGTMIAELDYASAIIIDALQLETGSGIFTQTSFAIHIFVLAFASFYVLWGGYKAVVRTDVIQVPLSYISFVLCILIAAVALINTSHNEPAFLLGLLVAVLLSIFIWLRKQLTSLVDEYSPQKSYILLGSLVALALMTTLFSLLGSPSADISSQTSTDWNTSSFGFGLFGALSLGLANGLWQFVDISSLQRLQSLRTPQTNEYNNGWGRIAKGLRLTGIEAGGVWLFPLLLAFGLYNLGIPTDQFITSGGTPDFSQVFASTGPAWIAGLPLILFALSAFMLSTIDGFLSAMAYVAYFDILPSDYRKDEETNLINARLITIALAILIYFGYLGLRTYAPANIGAILYAIWAFQAALVVPVLVRFFLPTRWFAAWPAIYSVIAGWAAALFTALSDPKFGVSLDAWYVIPPLATILISAIVYLATILIRNIKQQVSV